MAVTFTKIIKNYFIRGVLTECSIQAERVPSGMKHLIPFSQNENNWEAGV